MFAFGDKNASRRPAAHGTAIGAGGVTHAAKRTGGRARLDLGVPGVLGIWT
jgi:hypothetical protein